MKLKPRPVKVKAPSLDEALTDALGFKLTNVALWQGAAGRWVASVQINQSQCHVEVDTDPHKAMVRALRACKNLKPHVYPPPPPPRKRLVRGSFK